MAQQYMLSVHHRGGFPTDVDPAEMQAQFAAVDAFNREITDAGIWVFGGGLMPPDTATVVDGQGAETVLVDGPFAETKEVLGGFWVITAGNLDEALRWASKASKACANPVEVRPFQPED
ncbi:YciI family protein [Cryptosporangium minutisporangium]|uniref:YciI family protein n=1 Tax=Cryptosporangium minutisporangium TaxID=113569 RepID=A0ABP6T2M6_9ACTN